MFLQPLRRILYKSLFLSLSLPPSDVECTKIIDSGRNNSSVFTLDLAREFLYLHGGFFLFFIVTTPTRSNGIIAVTMVSNVYHQIPIAISKLTWASSTSLSMSSKLHVLLLLISSMPIHRPFIVRLSLAEALRFHHTYIPNQKWDSVWILNSTQCNKNQKNKSTIKYK